MAIHHAAHAYGNLEKLNEELSEEELLSNVAQLNAETEEEKNAASSSPKSSVGKKIPKTKEKE